MTVTQLPYAGATHLAAALAALPAKKGGRVISRQAISKDLLGHEGAPPYFRFGGHPVWHQDDALAYLTGVRREWQALPVDVGSVADIVRVTGLTVDSVNRRLRRLTTPADAKPLGYIGATAAYNIPAAVREVRRETARTGVRLTRTAVQPYVQGRR